MENQKYIGKYRATVINNSDPKKIGRLQVMVPDVSNVALSSWAMPCVPLGGAQMGTYMIPTPGAGVWVEFEQGDPDYPIWVGYYWGSAIEVPSLAQLLPPLPPGVPVPPSMVMQTAGQNAVVVSDAPVPPMKAPGTMLFSQGTSITLDASGVTISGSTINLIGGAVNIIGLTNINEGALEIT